MRTLIINADGPWIRKHRWCGVQLEGEEGKVSNPGVGFSPGDMSGGDARSGDPKMNE